MSRLRSVRYSLCAGRPYREEWTVAKKKLLYGVKHKHEHDGTEIKFYIHAKNKQHADDLIYKWNRYHGLPNSPGYGYCIAVEVDQNTVRPGYIHDEFVRGL
jgi:hypothetical protein